jgi:hypothetical protein
MRLKWKTIMIVNVLGILVCYSFLVVLAMPDDFAMPKDSDDLQ